MSHDAPCALRTHRRSWGLTQGELADLLGFESPTDISRIEHGRRTPGLETALLCSTLFGVPLGELFPQVAIETGAILRKRVSQVQEGSPHPTTVSETRKRELFGRVLEEKSGEANRDNV